MVKFTHESLDSGDSIVINNYISHEITTTSSEAIDPWVARKMSNGTHMIDINAVHPDRKKLYQNRGFFYDQNVFIDAAMQYLGAFARGLNNDSAIRGELKNTPLILIPFENENDLPAINVSGKNIKVRAHSSIFAIYVFVPKDIYNTVMGNGSILSKDIFEYVLKWYTHEIGARCGLDVRVAGSEVRNILDDYLEIYLQSPGTFDPPVAMRDMVKNIKPVNLLYLELRNDYAAGEVPDNAKKSIFRRMMAPFIAAVVGAAGTAGLAYLATKEKAVVVTEEAAQPKELKEAIGKTKKTQSAGATQTETHKEINGLVGKSSADKKDGDVVAIKPPVELSKAGNKEATLALVELLKSENVRIKENAAYELGEIGGLEAIEPLVEMLRLKVFWDSDPEVNPRVAAARSLEKLNWKPQTQKEKICYLIAKRDLEGVVEIGKPAIDFLIEDFRNSVDKVQIFAIEALGEIRAQEPVEDLIRVLAGTYEGSEKKVAAAIALGKIKDTRAIEPLIDALACGRFNSLVDMDPFVQYAAKKALVDFGQIAVPQLIEAMKNPGKWGSQGNYILKGAALTLGEIGDKKLIPVLSEALKYKDVRVQIAVAQALGELGDSRGRLLLVKLRDDNSQEYGIRDAAQEAIEEINKVHDAHPAIEPMKKPTVQLSEGQEVLPAPRLDESKTKKINDLIGKLDWPNDGDVRSSAAFDLGEIGDKRAIPHLIRLAEIYDAYSGAQSAAVTALFKIAKTGNKEATLALIECLKNCDAPIQARVAGALGEIGGLEVIEPLVEALRSRAYINGNMSDPRNAAAVSLDKLNWKPQTQKETIYYLIAKKDFNGVAGIGKPAIDFLIEDLRHSGWREYSFAAEVLGEIRAQEAVIFLIKDMRVYQGGVYDNKKKEAAALALGKIKDTRAIEPLIDALACRLITYAVGTGQGMPKVEKDIAVQYAAKKSLVDFGQIAVPQLIKAMKKSVVSIDLVEDMRAGSAVVLGEIGDKRAIPALTEALKDTHETVCKAAKEAIEKIERANEEKNKTKPIENKLANRALWKGGI
jgi:HEAT repeat protein